MLNIFLNLDPVSLKNCRLTCSQWNEFIERRVWSSNTSRSYLRHRLSGRWKFEEPSSRRIHMERLVRHVSTVSYMVCDESLVILAMDTGYVVAFDAHLGELKYEVTDCNRSQWDMATQVDIGPSKAVAVSGSGLVTIFDKNDGRIEYRGNSDDGHERGWHVFGIKMLEKRAIIGGQDGIVRILERQWINDGQWRLAHSLSGRPGITHIDGNEDWACIGTRDVVQVWNLNTLSLLPTKHEMTVKVWMLSFSFPFVLVVGGQDWSGVKVFNLTTGELVRDMKSEKSYHNVHCTSQIVTLCQINNEQNSVVEVLLYDLGQLTNNNIPEKNLWFKRMEFRVSRFSQVEAVSNTSKLFVSAKNRLTVFDFWNDGAIPASTEGDEEEVLVSPHSSEDDVSFSEDGFSEDDE